MQDDWQDDEDQEFSAKSRRLRVLPLTMVMLSLLFVIKLNEVYIGSRQLRELYTARDAAAETKEGEKKDEAKAADAKPAEATKEAAAEAKAPAEEKKAETKPEDAKKEEVKKPDEAKKDAAPAEAKKDAPVNEGDTKDAKKDQAKTDSKDEKKEGDGKKEGEGAKPPEEPKTFGTGKSTVKEIEALKSRDAGGRFSQNEIDLLQNLAKRRDELDQREKELAIKEKVLDATQKRINDRIEEMKTLETSLSKVVAQYDEKQNAQIASLVKIYEGMKPQQAATIFNELDMPILLEVIDKMSERKVSPVLAMMDPKKAKDVTQELAAMRKSQGSLKKPASSGSPAAAAAPPAKK